MWYFNVFSERREIGAKHLVISRHPPNPIGFLISIDAFHRQITDPSGKSGVTLLQQRNIMVDLISESSRIAYFTSWVYSSPNKVSISFPRGIPEFKTPRFDWFYLVKVPFAPGPRDCVLRFRKVSSLSWNLSNYRLASEAFRPRFHWLG